MDTQHCDGEKVTYAVSDKHLCSLTNQHIHSLCNGFCLPTKPQVTAARHRIPLPYSHQCFLQVVQPRLITICHDVDPLELIRSAIRLLLISKHLTHSFRDLFDRRETSLEIVLHTDFGRMTTFSIVRNMEFIGQCGEFVETVPVRGPIRKVCAMVSKVAPPDV